MREQHNPWTLPPEYWHDKMRERNMFMYLLAPFFEEASMLLIGASRLWHPWSVKRRDELRNFAHILADRARTMRQRGLAWACNIDSFSQSPAQILGTSVFSRYHNNDKRDAFPEKTSLLVGAAVQTLFNLVPILEKVEEKSWDEHGWVRWIHELGETLSEAPYMNPLPEILSNLSVRALGIHACLLECEGLAYMQARIEDTYRSSNNKQQRKKKSDLSPSALHKLAEEFNTPFETFKEVFEIEYSSWWKEAEKYREQAKLQQRCLFDEWQFNPDGRLIFSAAWEPGMTTEKAHPEYVSEQEVIMSERIIKSFMALFLNFIKDSATKLLKPALVLSEVSKPQ